jgi:hypothetical protein
VVQVHYGEGVAIRVGPEPCVGTREADGEASAGERIGQPLSRVNRIVPSAEVFQNHGRHHPQAKPETSRIPRKAMNRE